MNRFLLTAFIALLCALPSPPLHGRSLDISDYMTLKGENLLVRYPSSLAGTAQEVIAAYPRLRLEIERALQDRVDFQPTIVLLKDKGLPGESPGRDIIAAYAVPARYLIVVDYSKIGSHPLRIDVTVKHELCHLLLHRQAGDEIPKWLDEGVCQWVSGGMADIVTGTTGGSVLAQAALLNRLIPFQELEARFPDDTDRLILAYEQSRSLVDFIALTYGRERLLLLLRDLGAGTAWQGAFSRSLGISSDKIETRWKKHVQGENRWFHYLARNCDEIIFFAAALITVIAFIRILFWKKAMKQDEGDPDP